MQPETFCDGKIDLYCGDMLAVLDTLPENSIDSCVVDPPYHLTSIVKRFGSENSAPAQHGTDGAFARSSRGFMNKTWDGGDIAFRADTWRKVMRVLKPGAHLVAFSGTRTYHRMVCAIEDAGFEIRDQLAWIYGCGFSHSHSMKQYLPDHIQWHGWGTGLKPAWEGICLARKNISESSVSDNVLTYGVGAINIDSCKIGSRVPANILHDGSDEVIDHFPITVSGGAPTPGDRNGNVYGKYSNRSTTNHGASEGSAARFFYSAKPDTTRQTTEKPLELPERLNRFWYSSKADSDDRLGSSHPTVKPVDLMQWLVRLVTPPGGVCLDCFAGTGTTGEAAFREGMRAVLIELEVEYQQDIRRRMSLVLGGKDERKYASIKKKGAADAGPLFNF